MQSINNSGCFKALLVGAIVWSAALPCPAAVTNLAWYHLGEADAGVITNGAAATNTVDSAGTNDLLLLNGPVYDTNVTSTAASRTGSALSLNFDSASHQRGTNALLTTVTNNFGIEAWVLPTSVSGPHVIAHNGVTGNNGWGLRQVDTSYYGVLAGVTNFGVAIAVSNVWMHLALVCDNGACTLYTNGVSAGSALASPSLPQTRFGIGGQTDTGGGAYFDGNLDEVRVFTFAPGQFSTNDLLYWVNTAPAATTLAASNVTATNATLNASVIPGNSTTKAYFQYGATTNYGNQTATNTLAAGFGGIPVSQALTGLLPNTLYHFRVVARNTAGTNAGADLTFTTPATAPQVTTLGATGLSVSGATLNGRVNPGGLATAWYFEYSTSSTFTGSFFTATNTLPAGATTVSVSAAVGGLSPNTTVFHRLWAANSAGGAVGSTLSFVTRSFRLVTSALDDGGGGTLRQVAAAAGAGDTLNFDPSLSGAVIVLTNGALYLAKDLTVDASALPGGIQINGNYSDSVIIVAAGNVSLLALTITNGNASSGGGIWNSAGTLTMTGCTVSGNSATNGGGGIWNSTNTLTMTGCTVSGNSNSGSLGFVGVFNRQGTPTPTGEASIGGGGIYNVGTLTMTGCTVSGNSTSGSLGSSASFNRQGTPTPAAVASTGGGGIYNQGTLTLTGCTVSGNVANGGGGGGIFTQSGDARVFNTIVAGNSAPSGTDIFGPFTDLGANLTIGNPRLARLGNYGGPTQTRPPLPGSPALDAGDDSITNTVATDQRGYPRLSGAHADIGAVEGGYNPAGPGAIGSATLTGSGPFALAFANTNGMVFTVLGSTNVTAPLANWTVLGPTTESPSGHYQFTDPLATNNARRFYTLRSP